MHEISSLSSRTMHWGLKFLIVEFLGDIFRLIKDKIIGHFVMAGLYNEELGDLWRPVGVKLVEPCTMG